MPPSNKIVFASAGAGKTTELVMEALAMRQRHVAITTFTLKNVEEIRRKIVELNGCVPKEITVYPWYTFVLHELVRPYQGHVHAARVAGVHFANGATRTRVRKTDVARYYCNGDNNAYSDRLGDFALLCEAASDGKVMRRLADMYAHIFVDEVQDLAAFDIDVLELLLRSPIGVTCVGDIRQSTFRTSHAPKNKKFCGRGFVLKADAWKKAGLCDVTFMARSRRCIQAICDVADRIFPDLPKAQSNNQRQTMHDGVFAVRSTHVEEYCRRYEPKILRLNRKFSSDLSAENFGMVKGLGFERVLIVPYGGITKWLLTGNESYVAGSADEVYVGITRAYQSVAFVHDSDVAVPGVTVFQP
ncbi:UvrD-helicase domain-containing protein [Bradyrhizobium sp. SYSU BS000235]|uniref:UvrD-helicase domain-containing protein n=1 Tax=Bradyrhizobium sp. SYSU BS000235 TaxID=3411332 RepID=UPI003C78CBB6